VTDTDTFTRAGDLEREEAQMASLQHMRPHSHTGAWTWLCAVGATAYELVHLLVA
jgi:hypothetical protein